jgi:hypothetical protein
MAQASPPAWRFSRLNWLVSGGLSAAGLVAFVLTVIAAEQVAQQSYAAAQARLIYIVPLWAVVAVGGLAMAILISRKASWPAGLLAGTCAASLVFLPWVTLAWWLGPSPSSILASPSLDVPVRVGQALLTGAVVGLAIFACALLLALGIGRIGRKTVRRTGAVALIGAVLACFDPSSGALALLGALIVVLLTVEPSGRSPTIAELPA